MTKGTWGRKGLLGLHFKPLFITKGKQDKNSKLGRSWCIGHRGMLLSGLFLVAWSACFLGPPAQGGHHLSVQWPGLLGFFKSPVVICTFFLFVCLISGLEYGAASDCPQPLTMIALCSRGAWSLPAADWGLWRQSNARALRRVGGSPKKTAAASS